MESRYCCACASYTCKHVMPGRKDKEDLRIKILSPPKIAKLSDVSGDAKVRNLIETLNTAIERIESGSWQRCGGLLILAVDNEGGNYFHGYERAGLHHSGSITLLEVTKHTMLREMEEI